MHLKIQEEEAYEFLDCWRKTIHQQSCRESVDPCDETKGIEGALVFSFDKEMKPFLGNHWGVNPPEDRTYFYKTPSLMERIGNIMIDKFPDRQTGGRVFIDSKRTYYRDQSYQAEERDLCELTWPEDFDVVNEVRNSWLELPRCYGMTLDFTKIEQIRRAQMMGNGR
jgi:hypothetical protein